MSKFEYIYIFSPAGFTTGGVELLHQLCDVLNSNGENAYIVYFGKKEHIIPDEYKKYKIKQISQEQISDDENNLIVLPETYFRPISKFKNIKFFIWWLSVDNYYLSYNSTIFQALLYYLINKKIIKATYHFIKKIIKYKSLPSYSMNKIRKNKQIICNAYQSEYAKDFLHKHKLFNTIHLGDYINDEYFNADFSKFPKENIIIYNPKKGIQFTNRLIKIASNHIFVPIQNMTRKQVKELMIKAKVYIDFGYHPGKDRIPREAAMCGCCIITGKLGAAGYYEDLSIRDEYKFNQKKKDIKRIVEKIEYVLENYEQEIIKFSEYRKKIAKEKKEFIDDTLIYFTNVRGDK